ncbi:hypothetical protein [Mesorhizobium sp.]|uniref:hypothetical protein n=1 Tax=Mesorhizobium sp. TaxID=1871066 RepID=UPI0025F8C027|nr:hypothetical protein [Mesorhizobium sp.]
MAMHLRRLLPAGASAPPACGNFLQANSFYPQAKRRTDAKRFTERKTGLTTSRFGRNL